MIKNNAEFRKEIKQYLSSIKNAENIYQLFRNLNYPKETIFDTSYIKKIKDFSFAKEECEKIKKIYTVMSYDKLNVFLVETKSLTKPFVRYTVNKFAEMYTRCLIILTIDYSEIQIVFPDYEKQEVGKHKLKTTTLILKIDELYYTDIDIVSNIYLDDQKKTWREIWRLWKDSFNVQKVTERFFDDYTKIFFTIRKDLKKQKIDTKKAHEFTLQFLNRIMFIYFIAKKEWLNKDKRFMKTYWELYKKVSRFGDDEFYSLWLRPLFFEAFNNKAKYCAKLPEEVNKILSSSPYLNGGLFTEKQGLDDLKISVSDALFKEMFDFFEKYNFTIKEDSVLDLEVSVDPQMIGYVYESLANISEDVYEKEEDLRGDWGIFYTARVEVDFMCRRSLVEYLGKNLEIPKEELYEFVFDEDKEKIEKKFNQRRCWGKIEEALDNLSVVDPACGSGAFLVGMLNVLVELYKLVYKYEKKSFDDFQVKYKIIQRSLYGVDVMPWAIHAAELRLWLQLIVETAIPEEKLRKYPLLPNLSMNLRVGDSLVQEIGGFTFNVKNNDLKTHLKEKLKVLQNEKRKYFENSPTALTIEELRTAEIRLFEEILDENIEMLENAIGAHNLDIKRSGKQTGLFGSEINADAATYKKESLRISQKRDEIEKCNKEIITLKKVKELLKDPAQKPFVWDIDFAEVFADEGGFDIVIGNPPYVRQEKIAPPNKLKEEITLEDRREYKEKLIKSVQNRFPVVSDWDKKSDLYIYFYYHGLSLLNNSGVFCFITSNSWLDVGYGKGLQEFLLRYSHVIGIYDNQAKRSFEHADVNTIIALLGAPIIGKQKSLFEYGIDYNGNGKATYSGFNKLAKFIMFKKPFEEVITSDNLIKIENAEKILKTQEFRVYPINQEDLLEDGWEYPEGYENGRFGKGSYEGNKWGGKYLRAPDIFLTILEKGGEFSHLDKISKLRFGIKTGFNQFFILDKDVQDKWKIEIRFLKDVMSSPRNVSSLILGKKDIKEKIFLCSDDKKALRGTNALNYIEYAENKKWEIRSGKTVKLGKITDIPSIKGRKNWYALNEFNIPEIIFQELYNDKTRAIYNECGAHARAPLYYCNVKENIDTMNLVAFLNSTLVQIFFELYGRSYGAGVLDIKVYELGKFPIIIKLLKNNLMKKAFHKLGPRNQENIFQECGIDPAKPIREQEPKPLPDRAELDNIIFDELRLTKEERKEVYWAVCELVQQRLSKAMSLKK